MNKEKCEQVPIVLVKYLLNDNLSIYEMFETLIKTADGDDFYIREQVKEEIISEKLGDELYNFVKNMTSQNILELFYALRK